MHETIVVDTSCLIALTRIDFLIVLQQVYGKVSVTPEIQREFKYDLPNWVRACLNFYFLKTINL
jgi:predicted nucleic acid-binding protein